MMASKHDTHYSAEEWVDYSLQQATQERAAAMSAHLATGCQKCSGLANLWSKVQQVAGRESMIEPPASAVRHVRQAFAIAAETQRANRKSLIPRLVFDSLWQPALAGVRSDSHTPHRVMYKAGAISIDMQLEREAKSERISMAGQVTVAERAEFSAPIPVVLQGVNGKVATTSTNRFGEFSLAFLPEEGLRISFGIDDGAELLLPLDGSVAKSGRR